MANKLVYIVTRTDGDVDNQGNIVERQTIDSVYDAEELANARRKTLGDGSDILTRELIEKPQQVTTTTKTRDRKTIK